MKVEGPGTLKVGLPALLWRPPSVDLKVLPLRFLMSDRGEAVRIRPLRDHRRIWSRVGLVAFFSIALSGAGNVYASDADQDAVGTLVPKAVCGPEDRPETALQGQVPASLRATGFNGFNCNLKLISQSKNDGGNWQSAEFKDKRQVEGIDSEERSDRTMHTCGYYGSAAPSASPTTRNPATFGTRIVDLTDRKNPQLTGYLQSIAMLDPWESLKVNEPRKLLVADQGANAAGGPAVDVYDLSNDCRFPQLLASIPIGTGTDGGAVAPAKPYGHEGVFAPDGLTYYIGDVVNEQYHAVDLTDPTKPKYIVSFNMNALGFNAHGLSVSDDGNRLYVTAGSIGNQTKDGFLILDVSEVQTRMPNPQIKLISQFTSTDGWAQHTIPVSIQGKRYVIHVAEGGTGGLPGLGNSAPWAATCQAGNTPFPTASIVDIEDELHPRLVSKLVLEVNDPKNCASVAPDLVGLSVFSYGTHYCSVDNRDDATTLACGEFNSGIRVFDIRHPRGPKEIAYFNPAGVMSQSGGSNHTRFGPGNFVLGGPDWCTSQLHLDAEEGTIWSTCQDNGLLMLKFERGVWPFEESTTPPGRQN
jgi:hypothetical protein